MQKHRRRAGRTQRGRDLARHQPALAHASDHHPALAGLHQVERALKGLCHRPGNALGQRLQRLRLNADYISAKM